MQKKVPYVAQLGNMDCSIACMTMLFRYYGLDVDIVDVGQVVHIGRDGVNLTQLKQATQQFGFKCTAYRYNKQKNILDSNLPAVVYSGSHLAVIGSKTVLGQYILLDPIKGKSIVNFEQIHDTFSDILITIRPEKRIKRKKCKPKLKVAINYKLVAGIISLMLLIQALTLSIPLVEQALIDSITQSQSLLNSAYILVGCIVIAGLYFFLSIARQKLMLRLDISFVKEIMTKMLKKLFDIDPSFFEWHAVGEIVNRFSNVQAIVVLIRLRQPEFLRRFFLGRGWGRFYRLERRTDTALYPIDFPHRFYKRNTFNRYEIVQRGAAGSFRFEVRPRTILCEGQRAVPFVAELSGPFRFEVVRLAQLHILVQIHLLRLGDFLLCHTGHTLPPYSVFLTVIYILSITIISLIIISISSV